MKTSNPIFSNFELPVSAVRLHTENQGRMTLSGVTHKMVLLLILFAVSAALMWTQERSFGLMSKSNIRLVAIAVLAAALAGFVLVWLTIRTKTWSPFIAPIYAVLQGAVVGFLSTGADPRYTGVAIQAVCLTIAISLCLLGAYRLGFIRLGESLSKKLAFAAGGVVLYYLASFLLMSRGIHTLSMENSWITSALTSAIMIMFAGISLVSGFDATAQYSEEKYPKYMEWYTALGLMVAMVWIYIEILTLMLKVRRTETQ